MKPDELRAALDRLNLTQRDFARQVDVTTRTVSLWLSGRRRIPKMLVYFFLCKLMYNTGD